MVELSMAGATRLPAWIAVLFLFAAGVSTPAHAANQPPSISGVPATWVYVGSPYSFRPTVSDPDGPSLRFTVFNKPSWASFSTSTGRLAGTPTTVGFWTNIRIEVSDGVSTRALSSFSIRATRRDNTAPVLSGSPKSSVVVGSSYVFQPVARDAEGDPLRFVIANRPAWAAFNTLTGQLSGTPTAASVGTYSNIVITVRTARRRSRCRVLDHRVAHGQSRADDQRHAAHQRQRRHCIRVPSDCVRQPTAIRWRSRSRIVRRGPRSTLRPASCPARRLR